MNQKFCWPKILLTKIFEFFFTKNFVYQKFLWIQIFLTKKIFLDQIIWTQNLMGQNFYGRSFFGFLYLSWFNLNIKQKQHNFQGCKPSFISKLTKMNLSNSRFRKFYHTFSNLINLLPYLPTYLLSLALLSSSFSILSVNYDKNYWENKFLSPPLL